MTCIAGVSDGRRVWLGCDSQATGPDGSRVTIAAGKKVLRVGQGILVGLAGSAGPCQILESVAKWPRLAGDYDAVARQLARWWQAVALPLAGEWTDSMSDVPEGERVPQPGVDLGQVQGLIAWKGQLWELAAGAWLPITHGAIGSGGMAAAAVLHDLASLPPAERVERAVAAACAVSATCGPPVHVYRT